MVSQNNLSKPDHVKSTVDTWKGNNMEELTKLRNKKATKGEALAKQKAELERKSSSFLMIEVEEVI